MSVPPDPDMLAPGHAAILAPRLPADLGRLRDRYLAIYPRQARRAALLSLVPVALRRVLALQLELRQAENLPNRYSDLAVDAGYVPGDAVERQVAAYAGAMRRADAAAVRAGRRDLRRFFTEAQIVELTLVVAIDGALTLFDSALQDGAPDPSG